jgi:hypothetical protein
MPFEGWPEKGDKMDRHFWRNMIVLFLSLIFSGSTAFSAAVPKPEEVLGFKVGDDYHLATYSQAITYFKKLEQSSDRIRVFDLGQTSMGQVMSYAVISAPENMAKLEAFKSMAMQLSRAQGLSAEEASRLASEGRAIVYIDGGLHASECAPAQHNLQLAYDLVSAEDPKTLRLLQDVILVLVFANPDGMNMLAEWYHPNVGTPYEVSPMPRLYHKYAGHDNNRDSYIANLIETQHITRLVNQEWYPVILYNHHQTAPFPARIWIPPNSEPTNPNVHPLIVRWQNLIGSAMGAAFDAEGKEGAISRIIFDTWYPGYVTQVVDSHNIISIITETALYRYATPHFYTLHDFPEEYQDLTMSAFYPSPWEGGWWRFKDAVDYCLTASRAVLEVASKYRQELLFNKYKMGQDVIKRFEKEPPHAWIIPEKQTDPGAAALLLNRMILLGIDVFRSREPFNCDGLRFPAGTLIIPMTQANALFIKNLFEEQRYPDLRKYPDLWQGLVQSQKFEGAPFEAYDMTGWTLPYQFNVKVYAANTPFDVAMTQERGVILEKGRITGEAKFAYLLSHETNASFTAANRILGKGGKVNWTKKPFTLAGQTQPAGTLIIPASSVERAFIENTAKELQLEIKGLEDNPGVETLALKQPRVGIYQSWVPVADEGWTRFVLEEHGFSYSLIHDADIRAGALTDSLDVLIIPDHYSANVLVEGHARGTMPPAYIGGMTSNGVRNLKLFVEAGGCLIFLNSSCDLAVENFGLPVRNVLKDVKPKDFLCSGSILRLEFDPAHPLACGLPKEAPAVFSESRAFDILPAFETRQEPKSVARYASENLLLSGWIHGEKMIQQKSAALDVPFGKGRVILFGFPVQFRGQSQGTFKLLFNAIFYGTSR